MSLPVSTWRCFQTLSSDAEALSFSEKCLFSLATLEVDCDPATLSFALTEQERPDAWRWAIISDRGAVLCAGCEPSQLEAKQVASERLHHPPAPGPEGWTA
jgi:hypothetical protein